MKVGLNGLEVRLYPEDDQEQDIADKVARFQKRRFRYINDTRCLVYQLPSEKEFLHGAMIAIEGLKRGKDRYDRLMEKLGEAN